jgi:L-asparaginase
LVAGLGADVVDLLAVDSSQLTPADWLRIGQTVSEAVASGADGVVITHGTDTLEETALWLELSYGGSAPVVLTGAARSADSSDPDGPRNLRDALTVAASAAARDNGVLICFGGAVLAPLGTTKIGGPEFFGGTPAVGAVSGGTFELTRAKPRAFLSPLESAPRVDIAAAYPGADGTAIDAFVGDGRALGRPTDCRHPHPVGLISPVLRDILPNRDCPPDWRVPDRRRARRRCA